MDENDDYYLLAELHGNFLNIYDAFHKIPMEGSPDSENAEKVQETVQEYINYLNDHKRIIESLINNAYNFL
ncbi:TPA: hypothetical protein HA338_06195 [Methanosarcina acetivorans]|nr:hypothetical protein [Methanosarcina acetivorans]HIH93631.1 hypothetical protein [Methanosarcina acetivorans]